MELQIRGHGLAVSDDLRDFVTKRTAKLDRRIGNVVDAKVELRTTKTRVGPELTTAQITIQTGRRLLRAEERDPDVRAAIDRAVDKLDRQIRRFHDKRADRQGPSPETIRAFDALAELPPPDVDEPEDGEERPPLVRTKRFGIKPMDVDEAISQMELLGHDFYLFHNAVEETLSVVYRRRDGTYGLLVPESS